MYFDWQKSLDSRSQAVRDRILDNGQASSADLGRALRDARKVGMHNIGEAVKILDSARDGK